MILIKGGRVIDPEKKKEWKADVALDGQKIAAIGEIEDDGTYEQVIDAQRGQSDWGEGFSGRWLHHGCLHGKHQTSGG